MPIDRTLLSNMAISHVGISSTIGDVDTEGSVEAQKCRMFLDHAIEMLCEMVAWPFITRRASLHKLDMSEYAEYADQYRFIYQYPNFCKRINTVVNPLHRSPELRAQEVPYRIIDLKDGSGKGILCDIDNMVIEYNHIDTSTGAIDVSRFPATFTHSASLLLATFIALPLRADTSVYNTVMQNWSMWLSEAINQPREEEKRDEKNTSAFEESRY